MKWLEQFDERQQKEIEFSRIYAKDFSHGTDGHNAKLIIAKMFQMLNEINRALAPLGGGAEFAIASRDKIAEILGYGDEP